MIIHYYTANRERQRIVINRIGPSAGLGERKGNPLMSPQGQDTTRGRVIFSGEGGISASAQALRCNAGEGRGEGHFSLSLCVAVQRRRGPG
jgi:hypothetical protein